MSLLHAEVQHTAAQGNKAGHKQRHRSSFKTCSLSQPLTRPAVDSCTLPWQKSFNKPQNNVQSQLQKCRLGTNTLHSPNWQNLHLIYNIVKVTGKKLNRKCEKAYYILHKCTNFCTKPLDVILSPPVLASYGP